MGYNKDTPDSLMYLFASALQVPKDFLFYKKIDYLKIKVRKLKRLLKK